MAVLSFCLYLQEECAMFFINILDHTDECRCFSNTAVMNTYLMLYAKSIVKENITSWNGVSITLSAGQTIASKYYIAKVFKCSIDKAKNYLKTLQRNGLIRQEYNEDIKQNVITIPAVNPASGTRYVQMQIPSDKVQEIYKNKCKYLTIIYMYLTLHARKQDGTSYLNNGEVLRGELVDTLHTIASVCGCCVKTVSNVLKNLKEKGLLVFETIKNIAMKVKLLLYPKLKAKVARVFTKVTKKDISSLNTKNESISGSESVTKTKNEEIIQTPVTEYVRHLLFDRKKNNNVSRLNNVIVEVNEAVTTAHFPMEKLEMALDALYEKNKKKGDKQITASMIISFLDNYKEKLILQENERRVKFEEEQAFLKEKNVKEQEMKSLDGSWQLVKDAAIEVKNTGALMSFSEEEISTMYYLLNNIEIAGYTLLERGQLLLFVKDDLLTQDCKTRKHDWNDDTIAKAILLERLLSKNEVTEKVIEEAHLKDRMSKTESLNRFLSNYKMKTWANAVAQK